MTQISSPAGCDSAPLNTPVSLFAIDSLDEHIPAHMLIVSSEMIRLQSRSYLSPGRRLVMQYKGCRAELQVITCHGQTTGTYHVDGKITSLQEGAVRSEWRMPVKWTARVKISGSNKTYKAQVHDISVFGVGIQLTFRPELDSLLIVHMRSGTGYGKVRHCRAIARNTYAVGLYLEEFLPAGLGKGESRSLRRLLFKLVDSFASTVARLDQIRRSGI